MTEPLQLLEAPERKRRIYKNQSAQTVTANLIFPLLLAFPIIKGWVISNPEAYVAVQGLLNLAINSIREKLR